MDAVPSGCVVVGVDGSAQGDEALRWAAEQAVLEERPLVVLHAADVGTALAAAWAGSPGADYGAVRQEVEAAGRALVDGAARAARDLAPGVRLQTAVGPLEARQALLAASTRASLLVIGSRGRGPLRSLVLGSVSAAVARHAQCAVVVLRPRPGGDACTPWSGVTVGATGDVAGPEAVERAFRHATARRLPLTVLHPTGSAGATADPGVAASLEAAARRWPVVAVQHREVGTDLVAALAAATATSNVVVLSGPQHADPGAGSGAGSGTGGAGSGAGSGTGGAGHRRRLHRSAAALGVLEHASGPVCVVPER